MIEAIKIFSVSEKNLQLKSEYEKMIAQDQKLHPYKQGLLKIFKKKDLYAHLNLWVAQLIDSGIIREDIRDILWYSLWLIEDDKKNQRTVSQCLEDDIENYVEAFEHRHPDLKSFILRY